VSNRITAFKVLTLNNRQSWMHCRYSCRTSQTVQDCWQHQGICPTRAVACWAGC